MGLVGKLLSSSRRIWGTEFAYRNSGFAFCHRAADRGNVRCPLPEGCSWLRLLNGVGAGFWHLLVVSWPSNAVSCHCSPAAGLVCGAGHRLIRFARRAHQLWTYAWSHLCGFRSALVTTVCSL